jgi:hypothetical protein
MLKYLKKLIIKDYQFDETEKLIKGVVDALIKNSDTTAMVAPVSSTYYLSNDKLQYFLKTDGNSVVLTNHKFTYQQSVSVKFGEIIVDTIREYIEFNRKQFDKSVFDNQIQLLKNIKENLEHQN